MLPKVGTCSQDNTIPQLRGRRKICVQIRQPLTHDLAVALTELRFEGYGDDERLRCRDSGGPT